MIAKPTYALHLWCNGEMLFSVIEDKGIPELKNWYEYHQMINGTTAVVFVFFSDYDITRKECIAAATRFMRGNYVRVDVDLNNLTVTKTKGLDKTTPVH